ncbi:MAG: NAD(P)-binding domain-containing protein [Gemmatimonadetes bacterium]|nr:NAD(P)-binding domain-containing protein [Gemmatimonadota bacterium]
MKIGVLGTGMVGRTLGTSLVQRGHDVRMGSRTRGHQGARAWVAGAGERASEGSFADASAFGDVVFNCTAGAASLRALELAGRDHLSGKILIDVANPLDFSQGMPPTLTVCNTDSLGEQIQRAFPEARVMKTLNTVNCNVMVNPGLVPGDHNLFLSGNDPDAKARVAHWLGEWFGWKRENILDLGDITTARGTEMLLPMWIRLMFALGTTGFNWRVVVGGA